MTVVFPNTVVLVIDYLDNLLSIPVDSRVPDPRPARWVQVRRTGGVKLFVRDRVNLTFTSWDADDEDRCAQTLYEVRGFVHDLWNSRVLGPQVYGVQELSGPIDDNDEKSGDHISWFSCQLDIRAD